MAMQNLRQQPEPEAMDWNRRNIVQAEVFRSIHSFLTHASNISRILWPASPRRERRKRGVSKWLAAIATLFGRTSGPSPDFAFRMERATLLRTALGLPDDEHPLKSRRIRDHLEHFDERLDDWVRNSPRRNMVQDSIGQWGKAIVGIDEKDCMRWYDQTARQFRFRGESVDIQRLATAVDQLLPIATNAAESLWEEAAQERRPGRVQAAE